MTDYLAEGIRFYEAGNIIQAQRMLAQAVSLRPRSFDAWMWLGRAVDDIDKKRYCFRTALEIDPDSLEAAEAVFALEKAAGPQSPAETPAPPPLPPSPPPPEPLPQPDPVAAVAARLQNSFAPGPEKEAESSIPPLPAIAVEPPRRPASPKVSGRLIGAVGAVVGLVLVIFLVSRFLGKPGENSNNPVGPSQSAAVLTTTIPPQSVQGAPAATVAQAKATLLPSPNGDQTATDAPRMSQTPTSEPPANDAVTLLLNQGKFEEAIHLLDQQIAAHPDAGAAYAQRGIAYLRLGAQPLAATIEAYRDNLAKAIGDLDTAIRLGPARADDYAYRGMTYAALASVSAYRVDRDLLNAAAVENLQAAVSLGTHIASAPMDLAKALVNTGKCDQAQQAAGRIASTQPSGTAEAQLYDLYAAIDACQGKVDLAVEVKQKAIAIEKTCTRLTDLAYLQFNPDKPQLALDTVNQCIKSNLDIDGEAYYLRALIYYRYGNNELAEKDLHSGARLTWFTGGVNAYVRARISMDAGAEEQGLGYLQGAEASMTQREGPTLLALAQHDLAVVGAARFLPTQSVPLQTTPLPALLPTPGS
jgi:tetratricopeptide (TPR) repeat protein